MTKQAKLLTSALYFPIDEVPNYLPIGIDPAQPEQDEIEYLFCVEREGKREFLSAEEYAEFMLEYLLEETP